MKSVSRTPEGEPAKCPVCGNVVSVEPSRPHGDAPCPNCGSLLWLNELTPQVAEQLAERGVTVETDDDGEVTLIRLTGWVYDDSVVRKLAAGFVDVPVLDVRETCITKSGAAWLRELMPNTLVMGK